MRPMLLPGLRRLWRDDHTLQLGTDPSAAIVLQLREPDLARVLDLLDGSHTTQALLAAAESLGLDGADALDLVQSLRAAGLVIGAHALLPGGLPRPAHTRLTIEAAAIGLRLREPSPGPGPRFGHNSGRGPGPGKDAGPDSGRNPAHDADRGSHSSRGPGPGPEEPGSPAAVLRRRTASRVLVAGDGLLVAPLADALAGSGIGHVDPLVDAAATARAVARLSSGMDLSSVRPDGVDFLVQVGDRYPPSLSHRGVRLQALPRLEVTVRLGTVLVGPLVRPAGSPCRGCLELHRSDRDPRWPRLAAQLAVAPADPGEPCTLTTAMAGAAFAADEVLAYLDGGVLRTEAAIVEIPRPGELRRRAWGVHPGCDCRRRRRGAPTG